METLDLVRINSQAPYTVLFDGTSYIFEISDTAYVVVRFTIEDKIRFLIGYWLGLETVSLNPTIKDDKIRQTILCILDEFFRQNPSYVIYTCEYEDGKQAARNRLFRSWFNNYEMKDRYIYSEKEIQVDGNNTFISLIVPTSHPMCEEVVGFFDEAINLFKSDKP